MRVWKDIISGDEMVTDAFPITYLHDECALEAKARFVTKKENDDCGIAANTEEGEEEAAVADDKTVTVIDVVDALRLQEITLDKK